jgi:hypothetical protein
VERNGSFSGIISFHADLAITHYVPGVRKMGREQKSNKENKKKPAMTPKERKAAKKSKKGAK